MSQHDSGDEDRLAWGGLRMPPLTEILVEVSSDFLRDQIGVRQDHLRREDASINPTVLGNEIAALRLRLESRDR
jgi:hypothetical protein